MRYIIALLLLLCSGCGITYTGTGLQTGFTYAEIKGEDIQSVPVMIRPEWNINRMVRLNPRYGNLSFGLEAFAYTLVEPASGGLLGITPMLRYSYPIRTWAEVYAETGAGPSYISIDTYEQEKSGFTFLDQIGAGIKLDTSDVVSLRLGYRFGHLSHGRVLRTRNRGIETHTAIFGVELRFP